MTFTDNSLPVCNVQEWKANSTMLSCDEWMRAQECSLWEASLNFEERILIIMIGCCRLYFCHDQCNSWKDLSILIQVMAWCLKAPSHYLNQYWPRSLMYHQVTIDNEWTHGWHTLEYKSITVCSGQEKRANSPVLLGGRWSTVGALHVWPRPEGQKQYVQPHCICPF